MANWSLVFGSVFAIVPTFVLWSFLAIGKAYVEKGAWAMLLHRDEIRLNPYEESFFLPLFICYCFFTLVFAAAGYAACLDFYSKKRIVDSEILKD